MPTTKNLYEVRQDGATLHLTWCGDDDHEARPAVTVELDYSASHRRPSVDGIVTHRFSLPDETNLVYTDDPSLWSNAYDAAQEFLYSPQCDYDAVGEALGLTFVDAFARDSAR